LAEELERVYAGKTIACFSHAASVALVAALTGCSVAEAGSFAPCGIFKLVRGESAKLWARGAARGDNSGHCSLNSQTTYPWCFSKSFAPELVELRWIEAKRLGPS